MSSYNEEDAGYIFILIFVLFTFTIVLSIANAFKKEENPVTKKGLNGDNSFVTTIKKSDLSYEKYYYYKESFLGTLHINREIAFLILNIPSINNIPIHNSMKGKEFIVYDKLEYTQIKLISYDYHSQIKEADSIIFYTAKNDSNLVAYINELMAKHVKYGLNQDRTIIKVQTKINNEKTRLQKEKEFKEFLAKAQWNNLNFTYSPEWKLGDFFWQKK